MCGRTPRWSAAAALFGVAMIAGVAGPAGASAASPAETITGNFSYPPFSIQVSAQRAAGAPADAATGSFTGTLSLGGAKVGDFKGPVTCLDVEGNSAGLFYPVKSSDPAAIAAVPFGVMVTVTRTPAGKPLGVAFLPVPETHVSSCAPMKTTFFPITSGTLTFTPAAGAGASVPSSAPSSTPTTLTIRDDVALGRAGRRHADVLATAAGATVYTLSGATTRHPKCKRSDGCTRVWRAVTVGPAVRPSKPSNVGGRLRIWRHQGIRQLTLDGRPLYTFAGDSGPGVARGDRIRSFGGTWNVIRTPAALAPPTATAPTAPAPPAPPPLY